MHSAYSQEQHIVSLNEQEACTVCRKVHCAAVTECSLIPAVYSMQFHDLTVSA